MRSIINNAELAAVNGGMTVYEFQDQYPSTAQRESALNHMSNDEINEIIGIQNLCRDDMRRIMYENPGVD